MFTKHLSCCLTPKKNVADNYYSSTASTTSVQLSMSARVLIASVKENLELPKKTAKTIHVIVVTLKPHGLPSKELFSRTRDTKFFSSGSGRKAGRFRQKKIGRIFSPESTIWGRPLARPLIHSKYCKLADDLNTH